MSCAAPTKPSLRSQIALLCGGMILVTVIILLLTYWLRTGDFAQRQIERRMDSAEHVLEQYLLAREQLLITAARVLTADFGFKQAVATGDTDTITSALANHGNRIDADLMALINIEGDLVSATPAGLASQRALAAALRRLPLRSEHSQFTVVDEDVYQVMVLPVKAPLLIAHSLVGFRVDAAALAELQNLTDLDITLLGSSGTAIASTLTAAGAAQVGRAVGKPVVRYALFSRPEFLHRTVQLDNFVGVSAVLTARLQREYREFDSLLYFTAAVGLLVLVVALLLSRLLARGIANPLHRLVELTQAIGRGNFDIPASEVNAAPEFLELNQAFHTMGREISRRQQEIIYQAEHDILTGLYSRHTLLDKIDSQLVSGRRPGLVGVHIRSFKEINDTMGSNVGDAVLWALATRIRGFLKEMRDDDERAVAGRFSSAEFLIALPVDNRQAMETLVAALHAELTRTYLVDQFSLELQLHCGWIFPPEAGDAARDLLRKITIAIGAARRQQLPIRQYLTGEDEEYLDRLALISQLKKSLDSDDSQFYLHYQPKLNLATNRVDKVEALIRWDDHNERPVSPEIFIALAEQSGLITRLTRRVIDSALHQLADWNGRGYQLQLSINVSAEDISHQGFIEYFLAALRRYQVSASQVTLEITERDLMDNERVALECLNRLKAVGFDISIDDYGIGQSSLSKLKQLPVDELKIDKVFIRTLHESETDRQIVSSTIELGHKLGIKVVAEGVESQQSLDLLRQMGCDHIQGYHLSRPVSGDQLIAWLDGYALPG